VDGDKECVAFDSLQVAELFEWSQAPALFSRRVLPDRTSPCWLRPCHYSQKMFKAFASDRRSPLDPLEWSNTDLVIMGNRLSAIGTGKPAATGTGLVRQSCLTQELQSPKTPKLPAIRCPRSILFTVNNDFVLSLFCLV
jgi:hypothetical protein